MVTKIVREQEQNILLDRAGLHLCERIRELLSSRPHVNLAVPGGRSVARVFQSMREVNLDWQRVHFFCVDERLVPIEHADSNYRLLQHHLLDALLRSGRTSTENTHPFLFDPAKADHGVKRYERLLAEHGFRFDALLLSVGEDGHVGALFPHHHSIKDAHHGFIVMHDSPKPPPARMSSSLSLLRTAQSAVLLFVGEDKREAYRMFHDASRHLNACPAKLALSLPDLAIFTDLI